MSINQEVRGICKPPCLVLLDIKRRSSKSVRAERKANKKLLHQQMSWIRSINFSNPCLFVCILGLMETSIPTSPRPSAAIDFPPPWTAELSTLDETLTQVCHTHTHTLHEAQRFFYYLNRPTLTNETGTYCYTLQTLASNFLTMICAQYVII